MDAGRGPVVNVAIVIFYCPSVSQSRTTRFEGTRGIEIINRRSRQIIFGIRKQNVPGGSVWWSVRRVVYAAHTCARVPTASRRFHRTQRGVASHVLQFTRSTANGFILFCHDAAEGYRVVNNKCLQTSSLCCVARSYNTIIITTRRPPPVVGMLSKRFYLLLFRVSC